jgi:general stress protein YciG
MSSNNSNTRGFAAMGEERQKEIARKGGRAAHAMGRAHEFTREEARAAGKKGGEVVSRNRAHMAEIGRIGGKSRGKLRRAEPAPEGQSEPEGSVTSDPTRLASA